MKKAKPKNRNTKEKTLLFILSGSFIGIILILILIGNLTKTDLGNYPFEAEIWGTASDYLGILVTAISLFFIYQSLSSQKESIKQQERQIQIVESEKRSQFNPNIIASVDLSNDGEQYYATFTNFGDTILDLEVTIESSGFNSSQNNNIHSARKIENKTYDDLRLNHQIRFKIDSPLKSDTNFSFIFYDNFGLRYHQSFLFLTNNSIYQGGITFL